MSLLQGDWLPSVISLLSCHMCPSSHIRVDVQLSGSPPPFLLPQSCYCPVSPLLRIASVLPETL